MQTRLFSIRYSPRFAQGATQSRPFTIHASRLASLALLAFAPLAQAQTAYTLASTGDWHTDTRWSPAGVPTSADTAYINSSRTATIQAGNSGAASVILVGHRGWGYGGEYGDGQSGTLNVNGSLTTSGNVIFGYSNYHLQPASGTFNLGDNATVNIGGNLTLAERISSSTLNQGANTSLSVGGILTVGGYGSGLYTVPETGTLTLTGVASDLRIGYGDGGRGTFTYNNPSATLTVPGSVTIAWSNAGNNPSSGTFNLGDNTTVDIKGSLTLGLSYADGTFNQGANTSVIVGGILTVGRYGSGTYTVPETGTLTLGSDLRVANGDRGRGTFTYNNPSATLTVPGSVLVGWSNWNLQPSSGTFNLGDNTAVTIGGTLTLGSSNTTTGDGGVLSLGLGSSLMVTGATTVATAGNSRGRLNINGGTVTFTGALTIGGDGQLNLNSGAVNLPRQTTLSAAGGTFTQTAGSTLRFGLAGTVAGTSHDRVTVSGGTLTLGGDLEVELESGYTPGPTDTYTIITRSSGTLSGVFANAPVSGETYLLGAVQAKVTYNGNNSVVLSEVAEPAAGTPTLSDAAVSDIDTDSAAASVTLGDAGADVYLVWDTENKGTTLSAWWKTNELGPKSVGPIDNVPITGLSEATFYTCRFFASNTVSGETAWSIPVDFRTHGAPFVTTLTESGLTYNSAVLNGNVVATGGVPTTVRVYWAQTDQHPNYTGWEGTKDFGEIGEGTTNYTASGLAYYADYVYRYYATNDYGEFWGDPESFTTPVTEHYFNVADGDWHTAGNWSPTTVPIAADTAYISSATPSALTATIASGNSGVADVIRIAYITGANPATYNGTLNVDGSLITEGNVQVGYSWRFDRYAIGTINQGASTTVSIGGMLTLGGGEQDYRGVASGTYNQGAGASLSVGGDINIQKGTYVVPETGILTLGPTKSLNIGWNNYGNGYFTYSNPTATLTVPGDVNIGRTGWWDHSSYGEFTQGANTTVSIGGSLTLGGVVSGSNHGGASTGVYNLGSGTSLTVTGATTVGAGGSGRLNITVGSSASGLTVGSSLSAGGNGLLNITFAANPPAGMRLGTAGDHTGIHYGLKWAGDKRTELNALLSGAKLSIVQTGLSGVFANQAGIFYDSGTAATYVGFYLTANHPPAGTDTTITTPEDTAYTFAAGDFGFTDPNDTPPDGFSRAKIATLPAAGALTLSGTAVVAGDFVTAAAINASELVFTPVANGNGSPYASFTFQVEDDGGTVGGGANLDQSPNTLTINVTPVNDAPVNTALPTISGTPRPGQTLVNSSVGGWNDDIDGGTSTLTYTWQWQRADDAGGGGLMNLSGETGVNYVVGSGDANKFLRVRVTCTDDGVGTGGNQSVAAESAFVQVTAVPQTVIMFK